VESEFERRIAQTIQRQREAQARKKGASVAPVPLTGNVLLLLLFDCCLYSLCFHSYSFFQGDACVLIWKGVLETMTAAKLPPIFMAHINVAIARLYNRCVFNTLLRQSEMCTISSGMQMMMEMATVSVIVNDCCCVIVIVDVFCIIDSRVC
jgi:hypothetical protein